MKKVALFTLLICLTSLTFAQRKSSTSIKLKRATGLSSTFLTIANPVISAQDASDDCTPPPCMGIIDPWTCECFPELKDPWGEDSLASRMRAVQSMEGAMSRGQGKNILPASLVATAKRKYPGNSPKALFRRAEMYAESVRRQ
jgi:hypothetical protein